MILNSYAIYISNRNYFNLLVGFGKRLLKGWSHMTQMRSLKTTDEVYVLSGHKYTDGMIK